MCYNKLPRYFLKLTFVLGVGTSLSSQACDNCYCRSPLGNPLLAARAKTIMEQLVYACLTIYLPKLNEI